MGSFVVSGAPLTVEIAAPTANDLRAAISAARPGTEIVVTTAGGPMYLELNGLQKDEPGVAVKFPMDQEVAIAAPLNTNIEYNLRFNGGNYNGHSVGELSPQSYSVDIRYASKIVIQGALFTRGAVQLFGEWGNDVLIESVAFLGSSNDSIRYGSAGSLALGYVDRSEYNRVTLRDFYIGPSLKAQTLTYWTNGTPPMYSAPSDFGPDNGGYFLDIAHADLGQFLAMAYDLDIDNGECDTDGGGIVNYGSKTDHMWTRARIRDVTVRGYNLGAIVAAGTDLEVSGCAVGNGPSWDGAADPSFVVYRGPSNGDQSTGTVRVGNNTLLDANNNIIPPLGLTAADMQGPMTGDVVTPPTAPNVYVCAFWSAKNARPSASAVAGIPEAISTAAKLYGVGNVAGSGYALNTGPSGSYWSVFRGYWWQLGIATWQYRWKKNGVIIEGEIGPMLQAIGVTGDEFVCEVLPTNETGPAAAWLASTPITLVDAI